MTRRVSGAERQLRRADLHRALECTLGVLLCGGVKAGRLKTRDFKRYELSAKGKFEARTYRGASMGFLRVFCGALTTRLCGFCGVLLTWRVLLLFSVDAKYLFRYDCDMADNFLEESFWSL